MMKLWHIFIGAFIAFLFIVGLNIAFAASSGPNDCSGTANSSAAEDPWLDDDWEGGVANACVDNGTPTHVSSNSWDSGDQTYVLYVEDFGFAIDGTIDGVTVDLNIWHSTSNGTIDLCQLLDEDGARVGTNLCSGAPVAIDSLSDTNVETIGSTSELWGNSLTDTWVNDADFGIAIGVLNNQNNANVFIDYVQVTIEYTSGAAAARRRMIMQ